MKKYLIVKHCIYETYTTDTITRELLVDLKNRMMESIINTQDGTEFIVEKNAWVPIIQK